MKQIKLEETTDEERKSFEADLETTRRLFEADLKADQAAAKIRDVEAFKRAFEREFVSRG